MSNDLSNTVKSSILVVENSRSARAVIEKVLTESRFKVTTTATGPEALEHLETHPVDIVIMDVFMPLMNGYEVTDKIRLSNKPYSKVPIIAYTSSKNPRDEVLCLEAGMNLFITKTGDPQELVSGISDFLQENRL